jgi:polygalacturonase
MTRTLSRSPAARLALAALATLSAAAPIVSAAAPIVSAHASSAHARVARQPVAGCSRAAARGHRRRTLPQLTAALARRAGARPADRYRAVPLLDVCEFGATGDGTHDDAPAIERAILAANRAGGGVVELPPGRYLAGASIELLSHVTLRLPAGATLLGAASGYEPPEFTPYSAYQDPGHGDFRDAMLWGENLLDVAIEGAGEIDGDGHLEADEPVEGRADKAISIARCDGLRISGITIRRGGHFSILIDDCHDVRSQHLTILTGDEREGGRDGWDVVSSEDVRIEGLTVHSFDDSLVFKGDWALGETLPSGNVVVEHARLSSTCCNALMFGSETCGDFSHYRFANILITGAGKSGLGMVTMDGARISDVSYSHIAMTGVAGPIMEKVGIRRRCGNDPPVGAIDQVSYSDITAASLGTYTPTLWGQPGHAIAHVSFDHVELSFPAGHAPVSLATPADDPYLYNPDAIGIRPAYAFYLHDVDDVSFSNSSFSEQGDARPAFVIDDAGDVAFDRLQVQTRPQTRVAVIAQGFSSYRLRDVLGDHGERLLACDWCGLQDEQNELPFAATYR